jgi:predicted dehydrogenase
MDVLIVGAGHIGQKEVRELSSHPVISIIGIVDSDLSRANRLAGDGLEVYNSLGEALGQTDPDLVRIATPPRTHFELAKMALKSDSDVYIEKIMTVYAENAWELVDLAETHDQSIYVRRNAIYTPVYQRTWDRLDEIGDVRRVVWTEPTGEYNEWTKSKAEWLEELPGGIISEHLPHALYLVRWYLGEEPDVVEVIYEDKELHVLLATKEKQASISYTKPSESPMLLQITGERDVMEINHSTMRIHQPRGFEQYDSVVKRTVAANLHEFYGNLENVLYLASHYLHRELNLGSGTDYQKTDHYRQFSDIAAGGNDESRFQMDGREGARNVELFETIWKEVGEL